METPKTPKTPKTPEDTLEGKKALSPEEVTKEISEGEHDVATAEKNADSDGRSSDEKEDLKKSKIGLLKKGKEFFNSFLGKTDKKEGTFNADGKTLRERKIEEYKKLGYDFDVKAYEGLHSHYIEKIQEAKKDGNDPAVKKFKELLDNIENELFTIKMVEKIPEGEFKDVKKQFENINDKFAKIRLETRKLGQIKGILKLVDVDSLGKKRKIEGNIFKRGYLKSLNYMNSTDRKNAIVRLYNSATARRTNEKFKEKLIQAQALMNKDTTLLTPDEVNLLKSIDLKRVSGALKEDVTRTSFDNTVDGGNYVGTEIIDKTSANFTKKMEQIQQIDSRAIKMEGLNFKNRFKIWAENPANIRRLKSKLRIGGAAALLTGGLSNISMLGSLGMFAVRSVGALGGGEIFKNTYKKFATMPYQKRMALMRAEMIKNGDYLKKTQAGEIDSAVAKKIRRDNFGQMAAFVPGAIAGSLVGGGLAEMQRGGEFLDPTKRLLKVPGKIIKKVENAGDYIGKGFGKAKEGLGDAGDYLSDKIDGLLNKNVPEGNNTSTSEVFESSNTDSSGTDVESATSNDVTEVPSEAKEKDPYAVLNDYLSDNSGSIDDHYGPQLENDAKNETKTPFDHKVESTTSPYEKFMENYTVEESAKIRKGEGIYHALMRQTGNDKARVMALLKKHDYIKFNDAGELIKDVRVKDGMGAAYDLVTINGKETIIESVNGSPCHCDEFNVVEVKKACDARDLTTGKLERQEYVHTYNRKPHVETNPIVRPRVAAHIPDDVIEDYNKSVVYNIDNSVTNNYAPTKIVEVEKIVYRDRIIETAPEPKQKITPQVRKLIEQRKTKQIFEMERRGQIKVKGKRGRFWKFLGRLGENVLANEISYAIHRGDHGQDIIVCNHPTPTPTPTPETPGNGSTMGGNDTSTEGGSTMGGNDTSTEGGSTMGGNNHGRFGETYATRLKRERISSQLSKNSGLGRRRK